MNVGAMNGMSTPPPMTRRSPSSTPAIDPAERERPDSWLEAIRRLAASGREDEARRELRRFQREHPRHEIPKDLQRLAE